MSSEQTSRPHKSRIRIWMETGVLWAVLLVLFAFNASLSYLQIGAFSVAVHLSIALVMIVLLVVFFMDFREYSALLCLAAVAGVFWLTFMFVFTGADYLTRF
jgi:cytochrome c oxidase subunit IV